MEGRPPRRVPPLGRHGAVLLLYLALALALTWPLVAHFDSHVPGDGIDDPALAWNLWWIKARLVEQTRLDIFHVDWLFHPLGINFAFYTLTPLNGLLSVPLQGLLPLPAVSNLMLLSSFVLSGYGAYLLARRVLTRTAAPAGRSGEVAALLAGVIYAFASPKLFYAALGQFNIASSQWIPFCALFLLDVQPGAGGRGTRAALLAGLFLVFQAWAELTYASFLLLFIALYFVWQGTAALAQRERRAALTSLVRQGAALAAVALVGLAPFLAAMLPDLRAEGDFFASGGGFADIFSADLAGFLLPTRLHPLWGGWAAALPFPNDKGQQLYVGYVALALAALGLWALLRGAGRARRSAQAQGWLWAAAGLLFWLLALGPHPRWLGQDLPLWGPFALVSRLPFFSGNRYPSRYGVMLLLCVAVLAAAGAAALLRRARPDRVRLGATLLGVLFLLEHLAAPLPLSDLRVPSLYTELAAQPGDFAVLELPTGWRNGARVLGRSDLLIMRQQWYQTVHGKRRLGGNTSRNPEYKFQYFTQAPLLGDLIALMNTDRDHIRPVVTEQYPALVERGRTLAPAVLDFLDAPYVVVHLAQATPELLRYVDDALPLELVQEWPGGPGGQGPIRLYRVTEGGPPAWEVELGSDNGALHLAEGWAPRGMDGIRYATRRAPVLLLDLPTAGGLLALDLYGPAMAVTLRLNGRRIAQAELGPAGPARLEVNLPPGAAGAPVDRLELHFEGAPSPPGALGAPPSAGRPVGSTGATLPAAVTLLARSAGEEVGSFAYLYLNGMELTQPGRGYHLAAVGPDGALLGAARFDTFAAESESAALATWLAQWPEGVIVAGAAADEVSMRLTGEAVEALHRLGVAADLRGRFRWSHAFVGAVGAARGAAVEEFGLLQPAAAAVGAPVDGPDVYGGVGRAAFAPAAR